MAISLIRPIASNYPSIMKVSIYMDLLCQPLIIFLMFLPGSNDKFSQ